MNLLFLFTFFHLNYFTVWAQDQVKPVSTNCLCTKIYMPVCAGKRTFGNSCEAECAGFKNFEEGPCPKPVNKPKITPTYKKNKTR